MKLPRLYPPVWFVANLGLLFAMRHFAPTPLELPEVCPVIGRGLIWVGAALSLAAIISFRIHHTSVLPFRTPHVLMRSGVYRWSRNPIYLGEAIILTGACLKFGHALPWLVLPFFIFGANRGFIAWEETTMRQKFGTVFDDYCRQTRRWL